MSPFAPWTGIPAKLWKAPRLLGKTASIRFQFGIRTKNTLWSSQNNQVSLVTLKCRMSQLNVSDISYFDLRHWGNMNERNPKVNSAPLLRGWIGIVQTFWVNVLTPSKCLKAGSTKRIPLVSWSNGGELGQCRFRRRWTRREWSRDRLKL